MTFWPRRGIISLIGLVSMHLIMLMRLEPREVQQQKLTPPSCAPPPRIPPPKMPIK